MIVNPQNPSRLVERLHARELVLYGMGGAGLRIAKWCDDNGIDYVFADSAAEKLQGGTGRTVITPEAILKSCPNANVVISSIVYFDEITQRLLRLGVSKERILSYKLFMPESVTWRDLEHTTAWGEHIGRVKAISELIPAGISSVADYGEGKLSLRRFLRPDIKYYPIDYVERSDETIICDFNGGQFPDIKTEAAVCTATLVFIKTADALIKHLCESTSRAVIISYVTLERFSNIDGRRASGYLGDFTKEEIITAFSAYGYSLKETLPDPANSIDTIFLFCKN